MLQEERLGDEAKCEENNGGYDDQVIKLPNEGQKVRDQVERHRKIGERQGKRHL